MKKIRFILAIPLTALFLPIALVVCVALGVMYIPELLVFCFMEVWGK